MMRGPILTPPPGVNLVIGADITNIVASRTIGGANQAILRAFQVNRTKTVTKARIRVTVQSGNCDAGIYDSAGNRLASAGATAVGAAGAEQELTFTASYTLQPGILYYVALACDNTTATFYDVGGSIGFTTAPPLLVAIASSYPLPASLTIPASGLSTRAPAIVVE